MSGDALQDTLKQFRNAVKERWGVLTDKDLYAVDGNLAKLAVLLQQRYGYTKEQSKEEVKLFIGGFKARGDNMVEVVLEVLTDETLREEALGKLPARQSQKEVIEP